MKIEAGHPMYGVVTPIAQDLIRFYTDDGRCMFEVTVGKDGRSLEVRAVDMTIFDGVMYSSSLSVRPYACNAVTVETAVYETNPTKREGSQE